LTIAAGGTFAALSVKMATASHFGTSPAEIDMVRLLLHPAVSASALALFLGHLGLSVLPATIGGLSTPVLLVAGMIGSVAAAVRWL
jgi:hypothetical protein